ncbi:MAG: hypothetical protein GTN76_05300 [Candidatus Aenigmarchaeota archaeon]|nr:hypothetical protein [Candidatus Aenigmarchaeota archaeon]
MIEILANYIMKEYLVQILLLNFILVCVLFVLNYKDIFSYFKRIKKTAWIIFILILIVGSIVRVAWPGCMSSDGLCWNYVGEAETILKLREVPFSKYSSGYPFILAISFFFFGLSYHTILYLNIFLSSLTILLVFLLTYALFKRDEISLFSALVYSLLPMPIHYAKFGASEVTGTFFATLAVLIFIVSLNVNKRNLYYLSGLLLVFAMHARLDNAILVPVFILGLFLYRRKISLKRLKLPLLIFLIFMLPVSFYYVNFTTNFSPAKHPYLHGKLISGEGYTTFSINYLFPNFIKNLELFSDGRLYPVLLYIFLFISFLFVRKEKNLLLPVFWICVFLLLYGIYFGSLYVKGAIEIWHILLQPPVAILIGYGIFSVKDFLLGISGKLFSFKLTENLKTLIPLAVLILIFSFFFYTTDIFRFETNSKCWTDTILSVSEEVDNEDCLLIENSKSDYLKEYRPIQIANVLLPEKHKSIDTEGCHGREMFYLYTNETECGPNFFFGREKSLLEIIKNEASLIPVREDECIVLYKVEPK